MKRPVFFVVLVSMLFFSGCRTFEPEPDPALPLVIPDRFSVGPGLAAPIDNWWHLFGSDELDAIVTAAVDHNFDLNVLRSRVAQAEASLKKEKASFLPGIGFSAGGQRTETQVKQKYSTGSTYDGSHSWSGALTGSYRPDVWGKAGAETQSRQAVLEAAHQDLRAATLELTAEITQTWIDIIAARNKALILANQININQTLLRLQKLRFVNGKANALDVSQQREALAAARSQVPLLEKQEQILVNHLAFLTGASAMNPMPIGTRRLPESLPLPSVGIPSALLENRPDIKAAQLRLSSARWEISAARADLLPSFELTGQALFSSGSLDLLFHNWVATLAGSIAGPVFDGGFRRAEVDRVRAVATEQLNTYARTVAQAIFEVEDSLVSIRKQVDYIRLLEEELDVARLTLKDARVQYQNGQSSYLAYLVAWTSIERLERQLVGERAVAIKDQIGLYKALGWTTVTPAKQFHSGEN